MIKSLKLLLKLISALMKLIAAVTLVLIIIAALCLLSACSTERVIVQKVQCAQLVRPSIKTNGDLVQWTAFLERAYGLCNERPILKKVN